MKLAAVLAAVDRLAPFELAEPWDSVGLQVGDRDAEVRAVLVTLDPTITALEHAARRGCQVLLVHHPLVREPIGQSPPTATPAASYCGPRARASLSWPPTPTSTRPTAASPTSSARLS